MFEGALQDQYQRILPNLNDALLLCPIYDNQDVIGHLGLIHQDQNYLFQDAEIRLVQQVASQCAIALRQAGLYQASLAQVVELKKLDRLKDDFLSTVSHELRTPVSNMKMAIHMLSECPTEDQRLRYMEVLRSECTREINLINDLLNLQRLESGSEEWLIEPIQLQTWLPVIVEPYQVRTVERQQTLLLTIDPDLLPLHIAPAALERILAELLNNACKYTPAGGILVLGAQQSDQGIQIYVSNTGIDIPTQELERIFDRFYRLPTNDPWREGGTGLGLALVKQLTEQIGITIRVDSPPNQVIFTLSC